MAPGRLPRPAGGRGFEGDALRALERGDVVAVGVADEELADRGHRGAGVVRDQLAHGQRPFEQLVGALPNHANGRRLSRS